MTETMRGRDEGYHREDFSVFTTIFRGTRSGMCDPKRFIAERDVNADETFAASLLFLAISLVLQTLIWAPLNLFHRDLWSELGLVAVLNMMDVTLGALAIYTAWWIVGGRATAKGFFTAFSYFSGAVIVIGAGFRIL